MSARRLTPLRWLLTLGALAAATLLITLWSLSFGVEPLDLGEALRPDSPSWILLTRVRLPRTLLALLVGGGLAAAGVAMQATLRNPLADPYILGVSGGAALGGALALTLGLVLAGIARGGGALSASAGWLLAQAPQLGGLPMSVAAALGAVGAVALTWLIARGAGAHPYALLLAGVVLNAFAAAMLLFVRAVLAEEQAHHLLYWLMGNIGYRPWDELAVAGALIGAGALSLTALSARLNLLAAGDAGAALLGVDLEALRWRVVLATSLIVGVSVSQAGLVGFVGLLVPHGLRLLLGPDHRLLMPAALIGGAGFLVLCDGLARGAFLALGTEPPVGVITALLGGPFFLFLLRKGAA